MEFHLPFIGSAVVVTPWKIFGLIGVMMFASRWIVQMYYSGKAGKPVTPRSFWVLSMIGGLIVLIYFVCSPKQDMIGVLSNCFPCVIAAYNLYLDIAHGSKEKSAEAARKAEVSAVKKSIPAPEPTPEPVVD
jgi:lipid-A-disaccharide synthase-like uncharacterized protein